MELINVEGGGGQFVIHETKHLVRRFIPKGAPRGTVYVREHDVNVGLGKTAHRVGIWDNVADIVVIIFHMRLLAGLHGVAIKNVEPGITSLIKP